MRTSTEDSVLIRAILNGLYEEVRENERCKYKSFEGFRRFVKFLLTMWVGVVVSSVCLRWFYMTVDNDETGGADRMEENATLQSFEKYSRWGVTSVSKAVMETKIKKRSIEIMLFIMMTLNDGEQERRRELYGLLARKIYGNKLYNKLGLGSESMRAEIEEFALSYTNEKMAEQVGNIATFLHIPTTWAELLDQRALLVYLLHGMLVHSESNGERNTTLERMGAASQDNGNDEDGNDKERNGVGASENSDGTDREDEEEADAEYFLEDAVGESEGEATEVEFRLLDYVSAITADCDLDFLEKVVRLAKCYSEMRGDKDKIDQAMLQHFRTGIMMFSGNRVEEV